jgi:type IV pilus assembly protein PilP
MKDAINQQISQNKDIPTDRKDMIKIQVALSGYRVQNNKYPKTLSDLVPEYLDTVPLDPSTGAEFKYSVHDDRYSLGDVKPNTGNSTGSTGSKSPIKDAPATEDEQSKLLAYLETGDQDETFVYDPSEKRDPFRSFDFSPQKVSGSGDTPLEQYSYNELKLSAVLEGFGEPKAVVEDPKGKGHTVSVGTKVGNLGGTVMKIESDKIIILEKSIEFTGETQTRTVELYIR